MNPTEVSRICMARSEEDVIRLLAEARAAGLRVSMRGTQHSMGGQSIAAGGLVIDLKRLTHKHYDDHTQRVTCGTGCTWADLIRYLNQFGMSPRTMQSYSSFSVGGTIAVNGHGITTDECLARSVASFRLVRWDGSVVVCSRTAEGEARELFGLAIGGYGLFGVITEVELLTSRNAHLELEKINLAPEEFAECYAGVQQADVGLKMARLNVHDVRCIDLFVYRRAQPSECRTISKLGRQPRGMPLHKQVLYKWVMPNAQKLRYKYEQMAGVAIDWSGALERNTMMYVSADPVSKLSEPLWKVDDTFVLQEFFVPRSGFQAWVYSAAPIYQELAAHSQLRLLNTTIRFVEHDTETVLNYASAPEGMFAFVLYYRMPRTKEADDELHRFHSRFVEVTLPLKGAFYLPYRFHYTKEEMEQAYPKATEFFRLKERYDPFGLFSSLWFSKYGIPFCSDEYRAKLASDYRAKLACPAVPPPMPSGPIREVKARHENAFRTLTNDAWMRHEFVEGFLTQIFNLMDNQSLYRMMAKCVWSPKNDTDLKIYCALQKELSGLQGPVHEAKKASKAIWQLSAQKKELARETASIVARLGMAGRLHDYVSIGDQGKLVLPLREALGMKGNVWVVHRQAPETLELIAERGSLDPVGTFVPWELREGGPFAGVPDACADLATINQGLHHLHPQHLPGVLAEVLRVLRPGGLFIVREHDASEELMPMLELAHSVFNAVTGVPPEREAAELRCFRPIAEWRSIVVGAGFEDCWLFEIERGDPTIDEMFCFRKPGQLPPPPAAPAPDEAEDEEEAAGRLPRQLATALDMAPHALLAVAQDLAQRLADLLPQGRELLRGATATLLSSRSAVVEQLISDILEPLEEFVQRFLSLLNGVELQDGSATLGHLIPKEIFVLAAALLRKAESGDASANELFLAGILKDVKAALDSFDKKGSSASEPVDDGLKEAAETFFTPGVSAEQVEAALQRLFTAFPMLRDPSCIDDMGFDRRARPAMRDKVGVPVDKMAEGLAAKLDDTAWEEFRQALLDAEKERKPPTAALLFGRPSENPWSRALGALLGSEKVRFTGAATMGLSFVGLSDIPRMWKVAQARRQAGAEAPQPPPAKRLSRAQEDALAPVRSAVEELQQDIVRKSFAANAAPNVEGVAELLSAKFGYQSVTARYLDVTDKMRKEYLKNGVLWLKGVDLRKAFGSDDFLMKGLDDLRAGLVRKERRLILEYRSSVDPEPEDIMPRVNSLLDYLSGCGFTQQLHVDDGEYTWFKLTEWMQVEMLQIFGNFLDTSVWYRFPYTTFLKNYFEVLYAETMIVKERHGDKKAFASSGFMMSFVPGIMMTVLMGQLQLLALPLQLLPSETGFGAERDQSKLYEQLVVELPPGAQAPHWPSVHEKLSELDRLVPGLHVLKAPTLKALTGALLALAGVPSLRVLEVSNQRHIQVRVRLLEPDTQFKHLREMKGCQVMLQFEYPSSGTADPPGTVVALCVTVPYLLSMIRSCARYGIEVQQIFDFWCT